jgi:K+-transporting ATPase ATPase C chain
MLHHLLSALRIFLALTLLTGILYPLAVTAIAHALFSYRAGGSLVQIDGRVIGSELLAQKFSTARYFWPRPSAADYATVPSGASNLAWSSALLKQVVAERRANLNGADGTQPVPAELIFASGSGLDPHISPAAALYQMVRVATARGFDGEQRRRLQELIAQRTERPPWGFLGQPRVNVLRLNIELDRLS